MLHAIIMAGGAGTRFWPASRRNQPKQLLNLVGDRSMIAQTVDRVEDLASNERTLIVTGEHLLAAMRADLPNLPESSLVGEPCRRDTAPCIGLAALLTLREDVDATMVVLPADHFIAPKVAFCDALRFAAELVEKEPDRLVTFGIRPTYPAESFGYIERGELIDTLGNAADDRPAVFRAVQFREKPDSATAEAYIESGGFYWNSGIFVWKARTIVDALAERVPKMLDHLKKIAAAWGTPEQSAVFRDEFEAIEGASIDYAVMEHAKNVAVVEAPFDWDDAGSWRSLARLSGTDENKNTATGKHLAIGTRGSIIRTDDSHLVVALGLMDCIVVHTPNATLVASKDHEEQVRQVVKELESRGWDEYL